MRLISICISILFILFIFPSLVTAVELREVVRDGVHYVIGAKEVPERVLKFKGKEILKGREERFVPARDFVPLGVYGGDWGDALWNYIFADLHRHYCNTFYVNGSYNKPYPPSKFDSRNFDGLKALLYEADKWNIRIYYQNQSSPLRWPSRKAVKCDREQIYNRIAEWLKQHLPEIRDDEVLKRALLVWGPCEELDTETAGDGRLRKLKELSEELDPYHPMVILLMAGPIETLNALYKNMGKLPIILSDPYYIWRPFSWDEMTNWELRVLKQWSDIAYSHNSKFWICNPCMSEGLCVRDDKSKYKYSGHRISSPQMIRLGQWLGLANGASGFYEFVHYWYHSPGRACLTRLDWQPTEEYVAISRFFRKVGRLSRIVAKWKRVAFEVTLPEVRGVFECPGFKGKFIVLVNADMRKINSFSVEKNCYELEGFTKVGSKIRLMPGDGMILFEGSGSESARLKRMIGEGVYPLLEKCISAKVNEVWRVGVKGDDFANKNRLKLPVTLGGKGGVPKFYITKMPGAKEAKIYCRLGKILDWGDGVKVPSAVYHPPYPGAGENVLFLKWADTELRKIKYLERAYFEIEFAEAFNAGRLAVYPIVDDGLGFARKIEYMPRWEMEGRDYNSTKLIIELTGIVRDWSEGRLANKGIIMVFNYWPDGANSLKVTKISKLHLEFH